MPNDHRRRRFTFIAFGLLVIGIFASRPIRVWSAEPVQAAAKIPKVTSIESADKLLTDVPLSLQTWPRWGVWFVTWADSDERGVDHCYSQAREFMASIATESGELPDELANDALAWYLYGTYFLFHTESLETSQARGEAAERALLRSYKLDPRNARTHCSLGIAYLVMADETQPQLLARAEKHFSKAKKYDASINLTWPRAIAAVHHGDWEQAARYFEQALEEEPECEKYAVAYAAMTLQRLDRDDDMDTEGLLAELHLLAKQMPESGELAAYNGLASLALGNSERAADEFERAESLGVPLEAIFSPELAAVARAAAGPGLLVTAAILVAIITVNILLFYAGVMGSMVVAAFLLARLTRGTKALRLMKAHGTSLVRDGKVVRTSRETWLSRIYLLLLTGGIALFYLSIPFIIAGILGVTCGTIYGIFLLGRIPVKLVLLILVIGLGMAFGVIKSLFAKTASGSFGVRKLSADEPRLHELTVEVAQAVDTEPVDELYIAPGSEIGVHQEGRGPFGLFGKKRRVLTLGLASLQFLSAAELRAILAHEYAHFSHGDTFISRFVYQVTLTIRETLRAMAEAGGHLNYVNPFYWFLVLYYRAYNMMASGFSRSREFLADRMAASLYGAQSFSTALCKVVMHGTYYDVQLNNFMSSRFAAMDPTASMLMQERERLASLSNIYEASRQRERETRNDPARLAEVKELLSQQGSLFASHPTVAERLEAIADFSSDVASDLTPARDLLVDPEALEHELTGYLQEYVSSIGESANSTRNAR
jgi:Zn-dependent protease with chaperone function